MPGTTEQLGPTPSFEQALSVYRLIVDEVHQVKEWEIKFITWTIAASGAAFALHPTAAPGSPSS